MKIAINQPYVFPYIGYFQMINAVDEFVFYDDVNFIKSGWINRNNILVNNNSFTFTIPVRNMSSFALISQTEINYHIYKNKKIKILKTIEQSYRKAPFFETVFPIIEDVFNNVSYSSISELSIDSVIKVCAYLGINTSFKISSETYHNSVLQRKEKRVISICRKSGASNYINAIGGKGLYQREDFNQEGVTLWFLESNSIKYSQFKADFVPNLSIIDVLMFNSIDETRKLLLKFQLI